MKKKDIPQDESSLKNHRELCYAIDDDGKYTTALSSGWSPKSIALNNTLKEIEERVIQAKQKVLSGKTSPIEYYMELNKMDVGILAAYLGMWKWRIKKHFKPQVFKRLSKKTLEKYANVFNVSVEELQDITKS